MPRHRLTSTTDGTHARNPFRLRDVSAPDRRPALKMPQVVRDARLARMLRSRYGVDFAFTIIRAARRTGLRLDLALALIQQESGFRNVWGGDGAPNGGTTGWVGRRVLHRDYLAYKRRRGPAGHGGMQGVGPAQLTWWELQDRADRAGGCWRPKTNIRVGFAHLAKLTDSLGLAKGLERYNGSGPAARAYSVEVRRKAARWRRRLPDRGRSVLLALKRP